MQINILEYLEKTVLTFPDRDAVIYGDKTVTFQELHKLSKTLASYLVEFIKERHNTPIAVFLPKSIEAVVANIAITCSGNAYMNLDIKTPKARIGNILDRIQPEVIITNIENYETIKSIANDIPIIIYEKIDFNFSINQSILEQIRAKTIDTDPYCIINTSGSTGTPKGVVLNHKSFIDFTEWAIETLCIGNNEIIGSLSPIVFDIYSFELCMLMAKGGTIVLLPETFAAFPAKLLNIMQDTQVSFIFWVPTIMVNIANMDLLRKISLPHLKTIWFAGEVFPTKQFNYWRKNLLEAKFINLYGPIEITLDCTYYIVERELKDNEPIPIGFPCKNTDILILNEDNKISKANEVGELCVRGSSLAMGYYNNPEKTEEAFVQNPLNTSYPEIIYRTGDLVFTNDIGEIIFIGRKDNLVKHLGYRIELGEIEHVIINTLNLVDNGCVVYNFEKKEITLFYESNNNTPISEFKKAIGDILPKYMIPTGFHKMDELPRNVNGKIDRLKLNNKVNN